MKNLRILKRVLTFVTCSVLTVALMSSYAGSQNKFSTEAKTLAEIQEEKKANDVKIQEYQNQIDALEGNKQEEKDYQNTLNEQITVIQNNITLLNQELDILANDIQTSQDNIDSLNLTIEDQQKQIDANIELFKERLCAMYVTGNNSLASAVLGSADFYDMLSRVEMVNSIAEHDEQLVNEILGQIDALEKDKKDLETEKLTQEMKLDEQQQKKADKQVEIENLNDKMSKSQAEIDRLALEQSNLNMSKEEAEAYNAELQAQEDEILAAIAAAEEKRKAEAAEAARQAAAAAAAANNNSSSGSNSSDTSDNSYDPYTPSDSYVSVAPSASGFAWPAPGFAYISSPFGQRWGRLHAGIDVGDGNIGGGAACASKGGTVIGMNASCTHNYPKNYACCGGGYGNYVLIDHGDGTQTLYGHLGSVCVSYGQQVSQGQVVGYIGCTGHSTGNHLHFEIRIGGTPYDPLGYVSP